MSFLSGLGKAIGGFAHGVAKVAGIVGKVVNFVKQPVDQLLAPVKNLVGGLADKLPFGLGKLVKPFVDKFFDSAVSFLAGGPLGGLSFLAGAMPTIEKIGDISQAVAGAAQTIGDDLDPAAQSNVQNIMAEAHAGLVA